MSEASRDRTRLVGLAIGLLFFAVLGLIRAVLSFVGRGVD